MQYFAQSGFPCSSFLTFEMAIDGSTLPIIGRSSRYCSSVMYSSFGSSCEGLDSLLGMIDPRFLCRFLRDVCVCVVLVQL